MKISAAQTLMWEASPTPMTLTIGIRNRRQRRLPQPNSSRRGAATIIVLVLFAVTFTLAAVWAKRLLAERRSQVRAEERIQAEWLAEAGVRRAAAQLSIDAEYEGEEWLIEAAEINRPKPASVLITIEPSGKPNQFRLIARARYPDKRPRVQATKTVVFSPPSTESQP